MLATQIATTDKTVITKRGVRYCLTMRLALSLDRNSGLTVTPKNVSARKNLGSRYNGMQLIPITTMKMRPSGFITTPPRFRPPAFAAGWLSDLQESLRIEAVQPALAVFVRIASVVPGLAWRVAADRRPSRHVAVSSPASPLRKEPDRLEPQY